MWNNNVQVITWWVAPLPASVISITVLNILVSVPFLTPSRD